MNVGNATRLRAPGVALIALCAAAPANGATFTTFDPTGSSFTLPAGINASGAITGFYVVSAQIAHGFVRAPDGTITIFDPHKATITNPAAIDDKGRICGNIRPKPASMSAPSCATPTERSPCSIPARDAKRAVGFDRKEMSPDRSPTM